MPSTRLRQRKAVPSIALRRGLTFVELLLVLAIYALLMCFHATGYAQPGFNRYSLDYVPALFVLVVPRCVEGRRVWITLPMVLWSIVYFQWLI